MEQTHSDSSLEQPATGSREKIRAINRTIVRAEKELVSQHPWLKQQNFLGLLIFICAFAGIALARELYLREWVNWYLAIPLIAIPLSILHELEHDLIHGLYFKHRPAVQNLMYLVIWFNKLSINPWFRRGLHLRHHRESGQTEDLEERLIGLGLPPGLLRLLITLHPGGAIFLLPRLKRENPDFRVWRLIWTSLPAYICSIGIWQIFLTYRRAGWPNPTGYGLSMSSWGWTLASDLMVILVAPGLLRQMSIVVMSSYSHYRDIPRNDVFFQNQIFDHWIFWPFQLFCFNFGKTHIIHHYVVDQPFYMRQMIADPALAEIRRQGGRVNDWRVFWNSNRFTRPVVE